MEILHLTLHKKWFDLIAVGSKTTEYRRMVPYWSKRLLKPHHEDPNYLVAKPFDVIHFRNGYGKNAPSITALWQGIQLTIYEGKPCFEILIGKILEIEKP